MPNLLAGDTPDEEKKKRKPKPAPSVNLTPKKVEQQATAQREAYTPKTGVMTSDRESFAAPKPAKVPTFEPPPIIFQNRQSQRITLSDTDPSYLQSLNARANALDPAFVQANPGEAAALLTSATPTGDLRRVSKQYNSALAFASNRTGVDDVPYFLVPYYRMAFNAPSPERRALALAFLDTVRDQPNGVMYTYLQQHLLNFDRLVADHTAGQVATAVVGGVASLPFIAASKLGEAGSSAFGAAAGTGLSAIGAEGIGEKVRGAADWVGDKISEVPEFAGKGTRLVYGTALAAGDTIYHAPGAALRGGYSPKDAFMNYAWEPSFGESDTGLGPFGALFMDRTGLDPDKYRGLYAVVDFTGDTVGGFGMFRAMSWIKEFAGTPGSLGGKYYGEAWINTRAGKAAMGVVEEAASRGAKEGSLESGVTFLLDNVKTNRMPVALAEQLVRAATKDERARILAAWADDVPTKGAFAARRAEMRDIDAQIADLSTDQAAPRPRQVIPSRRSVEDVQKLAEDGQDIDYVYRTIDKTAYDTKFADEGVQPEAPTRRGSWEDGSTEPRAYYAESAADALRLAGDMDNANVVVRTPRSNVADLNETGLIGERFSRGGLDSSAFEVWTDDGWAPMRSAYSATETELLARRVAIEQQIADMNARLRAPLWNYPTVAKMKPIFLDAAYRTYYQRILGTLFKGVNRVTKFDPRAFFNDMTPREQVIYNPGRASHNPPDFMEHNFKTLRDRWRVLGLDESVQRELLDGLVRVKTRHQFKLWADEMFKAQGEALKQGRWFKGRKRSLKLIPESEQLTSYGALVEDDRMLTPLNEVGTSSNGGTLRGVKNVLEDAGDEWPLPVLEDDFMGDLSLSDIDTLRQASSSVHYADAWLKNRPYFGKVWPALRLPLEGARMVGFTIPRLIMKPLLFIGRGNWIMKVQFDQGLREAAMGMNPLKVWGRRNIDFIPDGTPITSGIRIQGLLPDNDITLLGAIKETPVLDGVEPMRVGISTRNLDGNIHPQDVHEVMGGVYDQIARYRRSELARSVVTRGVDGTVRYIEQNPGSDLAQFVQRDLSESMARAGMDLPTTLTRLDEAIDQIVGQNEGLRGAIAKGSWDRDPVATPGHAELELQNRIDETSMILDRERQARRTGNDVEAQEMARRFERVQERINELQVEVAKRSRGIEFADKDKIVAALKEEHANGQYTLPDRVYVNRKGATRFDEQIEGGTIGRIHKQAAKLSNWLYKGMRPVAASDVFLTRGSMYYQVLERRTTQLVRHGMDPEQAYRVAQYRAAFEVRDLMYDLAARSSFDRSVRDVFWFAPVIREQLSTWLYKIPSESYGGVWTGLFPILGTPHNLREDLERIGLVRKDADGDLVLSFNWAANLIGKQEGSLPEFRLESVNPITPGGSSIVPTLGPGAEQMLQYATDHAPEELKPMLKTFSSIFTFDAGEHGVSWMPPGPAGWLSLMGVHVPYKDQWNPTMWKMADDAADAQARQYAMSELAQEGITAPPPGSADQDWEAYNRLVMDRAETYDTGLGITRFLSLVVSPLSIKDTNPVADKYHAYMKKNAPVYDPGGDNDEYYRISREYVEQHPEALPYTIGRYANSDHPTQPEDAPLAEKIYYGDVRPLDGDEYMKKAMITMGFAAEEKRLRSDLREAGIGSIEKQLNNWGQYREIYAQHLIRMDDWFKANPEVEAYLSSRSDLTYSQQRLLETSRDLKILDAEGVFDDVGAAEIGAVKGAIAEASNDIAFGAPGSERERVMSYFFDNVLDPYNEAIEPLYDRVNHYFAAGETGKAFKVLDKIREISNQSNGEKYLGHDLPSPEEFSFNSKTKRQQQIKRLDWTMTNPQHLTDFQQSTIGMPEFEGRGQLANQLNNLDDRFYNTPGWDSMSDEQKARAYAARDAERRRLAFMYGADGIRYEKLTAATPAVRLQATGFGKGNFYWDVVVGQAQDIIRYANAKGVSPKYASESSGLFAKKVEFERRVQFFRAIDPEFDRLWRNLSKAAAPFGQDFQLGVPLYEHVFFGQSTNEFHYQDPLVAAVERIF